jgi:hypothetical protein
VTELYPVWRHMRMTIPPPAGHASDIATS